MSDLNLHFLNKNSIWQYIASCKNETFCVKQNGNPMTSTYIQHTNPWNLWHSTSKLQSYTSSVLYH